MSHLSFKPWWKSYASPTGYDSRPRKIIAKAAYITGMQRCREIIINRGAEGEVEHRFLTRLMNDVEREITHLEESRPLQEKRRGCQCQTV